MLTLLRSRNIPIQSGFNIRDGEQRKYAPRDVLVSRKRCASLHGDVFVCRAAAHHMPALLKTMVQLCHSLYTFVL